MTSTTSCFLPAASRAGTAPYSPDTDTGAAGPGEARETRSFDELCPDEREREETPVDASKPERTPDSAASAKDAEPVKEVDEADEADEEDDKPRKDAPAPVLEAPSIIQTLLASLQAAASAVPGGGSSAENADTATTSSPTTAPATPNTAQPEGPTVAGAAQARAHVRQGRPAGNAGGDGRSAAAPGTNGAPASAQRAEAGPSGKNTTAGDFQSPSGKARPDAVPEETPAQGVSARAAAAKAHAEKSAGPAIPPALTQTSSGQNKFLTTANQEVVSPARAAGTRSAIPAGAMSTSTATPAHRLSERPGTASDSQTGTGRGGWAESLSVDWKGWTNGGGERASTAAQFSQLGEKIGHAGLVGAPAAPANVRVQGTVAQATPSAAPAIPVETAEALAPIHSAIERLVLHGRDQLALTVRFEQGGSLSIKLAMNDGTIATQIQTDVPGLEAALRSSWTELAHDWNSRGWKLAQPEFAANTATYHQPQDAMSDGNHAGRHAGRDADDLPSFGGRALSPARLKHSAPVTLTGLDALRAAAIARRGIHTWA